MQEKLHLLILDTDEATAELCQSLFEAKGHRITQETSCNMTATEIATLNPDCIIGDISTPERASLALMELVRKTPAIAQPGFLVLTDRKTEIDYQHIFAIGVNGYLTKPIDPKHLVETVLAAYHGKISIHCWGSRGTLPIPGAETVRYGGNTNCVTVHIAKNHFFIFDGGTGLKALSTHLLREKLLPISAKIFFSHPHYDHINGVPFFVPFYVPDNEFEIFGMKHSNIGIEQLISDQMDTVYFPVTIKEFRAKLTFHEIGVGTFYIDEVQIQTTVLTHPGKAMGYRVQYLNKTFCYITDNELYLEDSPYYQQAVVDQLIHFIKDVDVLFIDTTYSDIDYPKKVGWGHSCTTRVVDIADKANVKLLYLHHHDPDQTDQDIDDKLRFARELLASRNSQTTCFAAKEGETLTI